MATRRKPAASAAASFQALTPDVVVDAVERALGVALEPVAVALPSYVNRVYRLEAESGTRYVAKFYRPGRWSIDALGDEHAFVKECAETEIPVVAPLPLAGGSTLGETGGINFAVYPCRGGRPFDADTPDVWARLGHLVGRVHEVGARVDAPHRRLLHPTGSTLDDLTYLTDDGHVQGADADRLEAIGGELLDLSAPLFDDVPVLRLHGDCQRTNVLERPGEGLLLIDFDDMVMGPAVQDLWLLLPDRPAECQPAIEAFLAAYEAFQPFDRATLSLIEPLRAMRMIHFLAWCARQAGDYTFRASHPDWGSRAFWRTALDDLEAQVAQVRDELASPADAEPPYPEP